MSGLLTVLPVFLPLIAAAATLILHRRLRYQRVLSVGAVTASLAGSAGLLVQVRGGAVEAVQLGGWPAPFGISLVADVFSALLLAVSMATMLGVLVYAIGQLGPVVEARFFHPLYLTLTAGVGASFLTGDLFNLFVAFEVMLISSYVLLTLAGNREAVRPAMTYVVVSLLSSTLFITAVGLLYAATGTVNMAHLSTRVAELPPELQSALALLLLVVFGIKAAIFPLFFWLPDSYPTAPSAITAVFAGLLTKVGVYAIIRTQTLVFQQAGGGPDTLVLVLAGATMVVGVLGAVAQEDVKRILSFHIVSQIGYMIMGLGLYTVAGLAGATLFLVHQIPVKTSLFLAGGMVEHLTGTGALERLGGMARRLPAVAVLFMLGALSLAGLPPFSGFFGKLALVQAGLGAGSYAIVAVSLAVSLLTLFSMTKIWQGTFWGSGAAEGATAGEAAEGATAGAAATRGRAGTVAAGSPGPAASGRQRLRAPPLMLGATAGVIALTIGIALAAEPLFDMALRAGEQLVDTTAYTQAVLGPDPVARP